MPVAEATIFAEYQAKGAFSMSANERVDIVNEKDEVIDTVPRHVMRERHLAHRASYMAVRRGDGRYLIEIRTLTKDYAPGKLDACVGGEK